ncbi:MAG TPA: GAF domain-containing protein [Roseiarcus sp.]|nr:GAF domain-containing protein [Roseiarcus sp.]
MLSRYLGLLPATAEADALRQIVDLGVFAINADGGTLLVVEPETSNLIVAITTGSIASKKKVVVGDRCPIGEGLAGLAVLTQHVQAGAAVYRDPERTQRVSDGSESEIVAPMLLGDRTIGVMKAVTFMKGRIFSAREVDLFARFARIAALLVEQTRTIRASEGDLPNLEGLGDTARLERLIISKLQRVISDWPGALTPLVKILEGIDQIAARRSI